MREKQNCAKCEKLRTIISRGLCWKCRKDEIEAGTIDQNYPSKRGRMKKRSGAKPARRSKKEPVISENYGICSECEEEDRLVPESGLCIECHAEKLKQDLGLDGGDGQPGEGGTPPPARKITAQAVFDYIRNLEAKLEASDRAYRKLRRSVLASVSAAQDEWLRKEVVEVENWTPGTYMEHRKSDGSVERYRVPDESLLPSAAGPVRTEED